MKGRSVNGTAQRPEVIEPAQVYRIAVIGYWPESPALSGAIDAAYSRVFDGHEGPRVALHAGVPIRAKQWPKGTDEPCEAAGKHRVAALFETGLKSGRAYKAFEPQEGLLPVEIYQRFADSRQANADPDMVAALVEDGGPGRERTINLAGLPLGLLVCGENNVLTNKQSNENQVTVRHYPDAHLFEHVRVVFNGAHTPMGNWGKLEKRFQYLSRERRWAFYVTNTNSNAWGRSMARGYYDGQLVADSSGRTEAVPDGVNVHCLSEPSPEVRYLALVFDIPGRLLVAH